MKSLPIALILLIFISPCSSQELLDIYKTGKVKLLSDTEYGKNNDWDNIFETYYDTIYNKPMGNRKSLKILPDGSIIVNHQYRDFYSRFSPDGSFLKEFNISRKPGVPQKHTYKIAGVINENTFYSELDNLGNMLCFDFDGNFKKKLNLDYMSKQMITLPNNKIAVVGWVLWKEKIREFVSIVDYQTNDQLEIWERFADRKFSEDFKTRRPMFNYFYKYPSGGMMSFCSMPFANRPGLGMHPQIACIENKIIVAIPSNGELLIYDLNGNQVAKEKIGWTKNYLSVGEQKKIQQKAIEKYKNRDLSKESNFDPENEDMVKFVASQNEAKKAIIPQMEADLEKINHPILKPMFSTIIKDSDGNLLFFEYPTENGQNKFNVWIYKNGGEFVCQSSFQCDAYELEINPDKLIFYDGYLYGLQKLKNDNGVPLRLVKFKLVEGM